MDKLQRGTQVLNRDKTRKGTLTGGNRMCQMAGCRGLSLGVRWENGKLTWPCTKGMNFNETTNTWEIV